MILFSIYFTLICYFIPFFKSYHMIYLSLMKKQQNTKYKVNYDIFSEVDYLKDCPNYQFVPTILPPTERIIAIGDIHGDINLAIKSFKLANLIDNDLNWIAVPSNTVVVQVGDQIDSCRPIIGSYDCHEKEYENDIFIDIDVISFFNDMHKKASAKGGAVYSLLGNHELMNSQGRFKYVSFNNYHKFKYLSKDKQYNGPEGRREAFKPGGPISSILACTRQSVLIIGSTMFVHAGILPVLAGRLNHLNLDNRSKLKYLNAIVRKWLLHKLSENDKNNGNSFIDDVEMSPFWTRIYGSIPEKTSLESGECFNSVKKTLEVLNIGSMVIGHTPQMYSNRDGINGTCYEKDGRNKLYRVDGGFSEAFKVFGNSNFTQVLEILNDKDFNIITDNSMDNSMNDSADKSDFFNKANLLI